MERPRDPDLAARLFGSSPERLLALMRAAWPAAVGPELARRTEVVALDSGVLQVRVPDATWRKGLVRMRGDILRRLRGIAGRAAPRSLGFVEGRVAATAPTPAAAAAPVELALPASVAAAAEAIGDPELRRLFLAVARRYLSRFASSPPGGGAGSVSSGS